jgi:hypothetical protein
VHGEAAPLLTVPIGFHRRVQKEKPATQDGFVWGVCAR